MYYSTLAITLFGIKLVGVNSENGRKFLLSLAFIVAAYVLGKLLRGLVALLFHKRPKSKVGFWSRQAIAVTVFAATAIGLISIWFDDPTRLASAMGLVTAALVFALQRVITAISGYLLILRGKTFGIGDRITMGGVRGDVVALGFLQTTIMEMGQPPSVQSADPAMWVQARQYSGRIVTVTNDKIFDEPVFNYTRDFPYIWEEIHLPVPFDADAGAAERILLDAARKHTERTSELSTDSVNELKRRFGVRDVDLEPRVFWRLTDNWLEMTVRFIVRDHAIREVKDAMSRDILAGLRQAHISIASSTYDVVGMPPLRVQIESETAWAKDRSPVGSNQAWPG